MCSVLKLLLGPFVQVWFSFCAPLFLAIFSYSCFCPIFSFHGLLFLFFSSYLLLTTSSCHITQLLFLFSFWQSSLILSLLFAFTDSFQYLVIHGFSQFSIIIVYHSLLPLNFLSSVVMPGFFLSYFIWISWNPKFLSLFFHAFSFSHLHFSLNIMFLLSPLQRLLFL